MRRYFVLYLIFFITFNNSFSQSQNILEKVGTGVNNVGYSIDVRESLEILHRQNQINIEKISTSAPILDKRTSLNFNIGDKNTWWAADLKDYQYYQTSATCRGIGINCYIFVEDSVWGKYIDQSSINGIIDAFDISTPANSNKGIYQTTVETFGFPPDVDNDSKVVLLILNIRDGYTQNNAYIAGYFDPLNEVNFNNSNKCELLYLDCYPAKMSNEYSLKKSLSTLAHEFQHMIMFNYHGMINPSRQDTFFDEGSSLIAEVINGYPLYEQSSYYNRTTNRSLLSWDTNNNLNDVLNDYSRAARFFLYLKEQFSISLFKNFIQAPITGINALDGVALPAIGSSRRFNDIIVDWWIANYLNDKSVDPKWGYDYTEKISSVSPSAYYFSPTIGFTTSTVYKLAAQYITYSSGENFSINFSNLTSNSIKIKVIKVGSAGKHVADVIPNTNFSVPEFGNGYSSLTFLVYNANQNESTIGPFNFSYTSNGSAKPLGTFSTIGNTNTIRVAFKTHMLNNFNVMLIGGATGSGVYPNNSFNSANSIELFNQETQIFTVGPNLSNSPHYFATTEKLFDGRILLMENGSCEYADEIYDPVQNNFIKISEPFSRCGPGLIGKITNLLPDGNVLILGYKYYRILTQIPDSTRLVTNKIFSPKNNSLEIINNFLIGRDEYASVLLPNGKVLVTGGQISTSYFNGSYWTTENRVTWFDSAELFDSESKNFSALGSMNSKRARHTATLLPNGKVLIVGGYYGNTLPRVAELFDPITNNFQRVGDLNIGRFGHGAVLLPDGKVLIIGGDIGNGNPISTNEIFDPSTNTFSIAPSLNKPRAEAGSVLLGNGKVLVVGGFTSRSESWIQSFEIFTPQNYSPSTPQEPVLYLPESNKLNFSAPILFTWNVVPGAIYYRLQISDREDFLQVLLDTSKIPIIGIKINSLPSGTKLYWRVKAVNSIGESAWSIVRNLTTMAVIPGNITLNLPRNNSNKIKCDVELSWDLTPNEVYQLQISKDDLFTKLIINDSTLTTASYISNLLSEGQKYYWRVRAKNSIGYGPWSNTWNFITEINAPANLTLQITGSNEVTLSWTDNTSSEKSYVIERKSSLQTEFSELEFIKADLNKYVDKRVQIGEKYFYRIKSYTLFAESDYSNEASIILVSVEGEVLPSEYSLSQNYPNPFNSYTQIKYQIPISGVVTLKVYDSIGREVFILLNDYKSPGFYDLTFDSKNLSSGIYFYSIRIKNFRSIKKMILVK